MGAQRCARDAFAGPVSVAREGAVYDTGTPHPKPAPEAKAPSTPAPPPRAQQAAPAAVVSAP